MRILVLFVCSWYSMIAIIAQSSEPYSFDGYFNIDDRLLVESKWKYTYALHLESNTVIHRAQNEYDYYLYFRYNQTYEEYLNGTSSWGTWHLTGNTLRYSFKNITEFTVAEVNKRRLVLEFQQPNAKGTYQYHFVRVRSEEAPFIKPPNELPDVYVDAYSPREARRQDRQLAQQSRRERRRQRRATERRKNRETAADLPRFTVELIGGGFYGGVDPVLKDYITINAQGRLIKEFESVYNGLIVTKKDIPTAELEAFAEFVLAQDFFDLDRMYDCASVDCQRRKHDRPTPIPLRLAVTHGDRRKVVTISIWSKDNRQVQYVEYPKEIDHIVEAIHRMALRI